MDETWRPKWQQLLITLSTWVTLSLAHASVMINTETFERARKMVGMKDKVVLIKNGIAPINFLSKDAARASLSLSIPSDHTLIGGVGELHPNKNWVTAINMLSSFPTNVHLAIIGTGEEQEQLTHQIEMLRLSNRVHLLGYVQNAATYLKAFDIFLLPSKKEGLPYVLLEAGLAELPVVATDLPGNRDIIESGEEGFLVGPEPRLLATPIEMLLRDEGMRRRLGSALNARVTREFSIEHMTKVTFALYSKSPFAS